MNLPLTSKTGARKAGVLGQYTTTWRGLRPAFRLLESQVVHRPSLHSIPQTLEAQGPQPYQGFEGRLFAFLALENLTEKKPIAGEMEYHGGDSYESGLFW
jgi:hypothetical protein